MSLDEQTLTKADDVLMQPEKGSGSVSELDENKVKIDHLQFQFEAWADKIMIMIDDYRSGFECMACKGTGKVLAQCSCVVADRPGLKNRFNETCEDCHGDYKSKEQWIVCSSC